MGSDFRILKVFTKNSRTLESSEYTEWDRKIRSDLVFESLSNNSEESQMLVRFLCELKYTYLYEKKIKNHLKLQGKFTKDQLERAKTQLSRQFLRDMEVRAMMMEAFARETVAYGEPTNPNVRVKYLKSAN